MVRYFRSGYSKDLPIYILALVLVVVAVVELDVRSN
jgi:hypothetical protein